MPRNKKVKQRAIDLKAVNNNENTVVISNLAANDTNAVTQMDNLRSLQEMFANRLDPEIIDSVFQECAANFNQTLENLLEMCGDSINELVPNRDTLPLSAQLHAFNTSNHTIDEVPYTVSEPPLTDSTNSNNRDVGNRTTYNREPVEVLNLLPLNLKVNHKPSPLNAVMPFANIFSPKSIQSAAISAKSSQPSSSKLKEVSLKDDIKQMIRKKHKIMVLMRGLPGSGKTTLANQLVYGSDGIILSTDDYFIKNGTYRFDPNQLSIAHEWNQKRAKKYAENGKSPVIIDNTNLEGWEMRPYVSFAYTRGYKIYFLEPDTYWSRNPKELSRRNIHGITKEKLESMIQKFERVTVDDVVKTLPTTHLLQKSNSTQVMNSKIVSTNATKLISRSISSPTNAWTVNNSGVSSDYEESPQSSSAQLCNFQEESSSSLNSTEPTDSLNDNKIDIDLLIALNQRNTDSEDSSSVNASDGGSSCVSQEFGWERDDEFTYTDNQQQHDMDQSTSCNGLQTENPIYESPKEPIFQKEHLISNTTIDDIKEETVEEVVSNETTGKSNNDNIVSNVNNMSTTNGAQEVSLQNTSNTKRMFSLVGVPKQLGQQNWEFPSFPIDLNDKNDKSEVSITFHSRFSQTELKDWALLELRQCNKDSNEGLDTDSSDGEEIISETKVYDIKSSLGVRFHKGTDTNDMPDDLSRDQKLNTLRQKFPKAENNHLNEILDACHEDYLWAEKLLSELNEDHFDVGSLEQLSNGTEARVSSPETISESLSNSGEEDLQENLNNRKDSDEPIFSLTLDTFLAAQLQSQFGVITDTLTEDDLTITLSHGVARLLHHNWKKSLNQKDLSQTKPKPQSTTDSKIFNNHQNKSQNINNNMNNNKVSKNQTKESALEVLPKSEFQEILDIEMAKDLSRKEYQKSLAANALNSSCPTKRQNAKDLLSTKLKRDQLFQRYPGVDQSFLDTIFESNTYCLGKTIDVLDNSLGLDDDFTKEINELIAEEKYSPQNGSPMNGSRSASPLKSIRKPIDINSNISQMSSLLVKKKETHDRARLAFNRKQFAVASYYANEANQLHLNIDRLSKETVDAILYNSINTNELDLHGLRLPEVNAILSEYLCRKCDELKRTQGRRKLSVDIITGYGATKGVMGRIKPAVIQYLKQKNFAYETVNMGVIRVNLTQ